MNSDENSGKKKLLRRVGGSLFGLSKRILDRKVLNVVAAEAEAPLSSRYGYDSYGFSLCENEFAAGIKRYEEQFQVKIQRRLKRWEGIDWKSKINDDDNVLKMLIRKGIPDHMRSQVWLHLLGANQVQKENVGVYEHLLTQPLDHHVASEIDLDITRTFPSNRNYAVESGTNKLRNVLHAFAVYMPSINYCQSLNFLAALFLLFMDEKDSFWCLTQVVRFQAFLKNPGYYKSGMFDLRRDVRVLDLILERRLPKLYRHLKENAIDLMSLCAEWFLCLFSISLPIPTVLRVWDALFNEGEKVLFRVAFSLFKIHEQRLLQLDSDRDLLSACKSMPKGLVQHDELIKIAFYHLPAFGRGNIWQLRQHTTQQMLTET
ncbi:bifunctional Rab-GTPase-TBC domain/Rab-GTPase-TBC domain superfamily [Babesia duncani]|uniref:Bifunctional Rab-GTPase-TBC domain/Rab-GTPase-TBC domain superfamily n=1 Tax=Babesia duncani TaxID=323732 RepID=A0AAD9UPY5_9APIC|nr:bifunctional Rab-GTPase-TBC domain/Rab-GTPase-TBC domain superfamily [Babesia duncani]